MTKKEFTLLYAVKKYGACSAGKLKRLTGLSSAFVSRALGAFRRRGLLDGRGLSPLGLRELAPYKVDNAVIMAAGLSSRFVPLSLEKPKGLLVVRGEVLIERQIEQLQAAGIREILLVLGYKKEAFFYLREKYPGIRILENPLYNQRNNPYTLYLAREYLGNSYVCSSDDYFVENPFDEYVYQSYYAGVRVEEKTDEWYMFPNARGDIVRVAKTGEAGIIQLGHVYWDRRFSAAMRAILEEDQRVGRYEQSLWEQILLDHVRELPPMEAKVYPHGVIYEFDSLEDLRSFDERYVDHTGSQIMADIAETFRCREGEITRPRWIKEGLTNNSFSFSVRGGRFVYRQPGEGTEAIISRPHEKTALELAREIGIDPSFLCMDGERGWKISRFVEGVRTPRYDSREDSLRVIGQLRKLHRSALCVDWAFLPWEESLRLEELLRRDKGGVPDPAFPALKAAVGRCVELCRGDGVEPCFCHCDTYSPNWMLTDRGDTLLIDWEYAGLADPGCDLGSYISDTAWEPEEAEWFIRSYCAGDYSPVLRTHYLAYSAIMGYYWYVWAMYRESCGAVMDESLRTWRASAKRFSDYLLRETEGDAGPLPGEKEEAAC